MEAAAGVAATGRAGTLPMPSSQSARKEWRAVSEHPVRNSGNEEMERSKLGQSDERTIYEHGTGPLEVDFCSITIDENLTTDLHDISRRREELQQMEIELRAQVIARSEMLEMQKSFDAQIKEHVNTNAKLKEQLQEQDQCMRELELKMEEKDRELRAIRIDSEAAWAKEDLLREQTKELATFRRERDNSEAERAQHLQQLHDLKEHFQEKERQFLELEEQHRVAQESIIYKDEQLREAQAWVTRVQEMDALHSTTNHSLQTELRERTEQFNQFWLGCQRQFAEMERHHMQTIQQLQLELAEARERNGIFPEDSHVAHSTSKDVVAAYVQNKANQFNVNESGALDGNSGIMPNGNLDRAPPFVSAGNASNKSDHAPGVPVVPSSILGMGAFLPPGQVPTMHSFVMHQHAVPHGATLATSHIPQSHVSHFQSMPSISTHQNLHSPQVVAESSQAPNQSQYKAQNEQNHLRTDAHYGYELSQDGHTHSDYLKAHLSSHQRSSPVIAAPSEELQVTETNDKQYLIPQDPEQNLQENSSQLHDTFKSDLPEQKSEPKATMENQALELADISTGQESGSLLPQPGGEDNGIGASKQLQEQGLATQPWKTSEVPLSAGTKSQGSSVDAPECITSGMILPEVHVSAGWTPTSVITTGKTSKPNLLDERSLLACIVRAIPSGASNRIRISTTLPNRLGKMLAPLHWHDYKKQYGKLDDFVVRHPELFVIEGDFIHLREGAQEIVSATTAAAKVAAAASAPYSSLLPSVAVTPVAQPYRLKKVPTVDPKPGKISLSTEGAVVSNPADGRPSHLLGMQDKHSNGVGLNIAQGLSNVKILSKSKDTPELNGFSSEMRAGHSSVHMTVANGANPGVATLHNRGSSNGRHGTNFGGKQQGRSIGAGLMTRR